VKKALLLACILPAAAAAYAQSGDWRIGGRSSLDFGSFVIEQDVQVTWRDRFFLGLDLVTSMKTPFMFYPGALESQGLVRAWTYNIDLETRLEAGTLWAPWSWLTFRGGLDASLLMNFSKYNISNDTYSIDMDWTGFYWILEPAVFLTADLDYGTWFHVEALQGWDLRLGVRFPLRDIYYDYERLRLILALGWEY